MKSLASKEQRLSASASKSTSEADLADQKAVSCQFPRGDLALSEPKTRKNIENERIAEKKEQYYQQAPLLSKEKKAFLTKIRPS